MFRDRHHSSRSGLLVCSPPRSPLPLRHRPQGSRDFSIRAEPALLPSQASDMLAVRTRQLTAEDFHLFRLAALSAAPRACPSRTTPRARRPSTIRLSTKSFCAVIVNYTLLVTRIGFGGYPIGQLPYLMRKLRGQ